MRVWSVRSAVWQLAAFKIHKFLAIFVTSNILPWTAVDPRRIFIVAQQFQPQTQQTSSARTIKASYQPCSYQISITVRHAAFSISPSPSCCRLHISIKHKPFPTLVTINCRVSQAATDPYCFAINSLIFKPFLSLMNNGYHLFKEYIVRGLIYVSEES